MLMFLHSVKKYVSFWENENLLLFIAEFGSNASSVLSSSPLVRDKDFVGDKIFNFFSVLIYSVDEPQTDIQSVFFNPSWLEFLIFREFIMGVFKWNEFSLIFETLYLSWVEIILFWLSLSKFEGRIFFCYFFGLFIMSFKTLELLFLSSLINLWFTASIFVGSF